MIRTLQKRLILLTVAGLFLASGILAAAIHFMNLRSLTMQVEGVLSMLAENGGQRPMALERSAGDAPDPSGAPPEKPAGTRPPDMPEKPAGTVPPDSGDLFRGSREIRNAADLSNFYVAELNEDGTVKSWESDRADLYTDEEISAFAAEIVSSGAASGRIGDRFFRRSGQKLIVVDAAVDFQNVYGYLRVTLLVAVAQWLVLSLGAVWLIRRLVKPVDEAMEKQKQFVWDASHELKTPLAVISANAEVLAGEIGDNPSLTYIQSEVKRSDKLVQNLLTLARMEKGTIRAEHRPFDLGRALLSVTLPFESAVYEAGKTMETMIPDQVMLTGDEEMIKQLALILLSNAVKYSDPQGHITVRLEARGDRRVIRVHNTGPAIAPADQARIFDRFYRVDSSHNRENPGNGLGLAIARSIVDLHKGKITVQSEAGKGTEFTVVL